MDQETLDALFKKGAIQQSTRDMLPPSAPEAAPSPQAAAPSPIEQDLNRQQVGAEMMTTPVLPGDANRANAVDAAAVNSVLSNHDAKQRADQELAQSAADKAAHDQAQIAQTNATRAKLGLPQLPGGAPIQPASFTPAVATPGDAGKGIKLASDEKRVVPVGDATSPLDRSFELEQQGLAQAGAAGAKQAAAEAGYISETQKQMQRMDAAARVEEAERKKHLDERMQAMDLAAKESAKLGEIDPNRLYKNMGTGQKIATALSVFLGGFSKDGNNLALKMLTDSVDSDIAAQKNAQEQAKGKVTQQQTLYGDMLRRFGDERQAEAATRLAYLNNMELQLKKAAAQFRGPQIGAQTLMGEARIEQQKQQTKLMFQKAVEDKQAKDRLMGGNTDNLSNDLERLPEKDRERFVNLPGISGFAPSAERAKQFGEDARTTVGSIKSIDELLKMDRSLPLSEQRARASVLQTTLIGALNRPMTGGGPMQKEERELIKNIAANPTEYLSANAHPKLRQLREFLQNRLNTAAEGEGFKTLKLGKAQ